MTYTHGCMRKPCFLCASQAGALSRTVCQHVQPLCSPLEGCGVALTLLPSGSLLYVAEYLKMCFASGIWLGAGSAGTWSRTCR